MLNECKFDLDAELKKCKTPEDLTGKNGLIKKLFGKMLEEMLAQEMNDHLGYRKHDPKGYLSGNSRNGITSKKVKSSLGDVDISVPRDRNGTFEPLVVKKRQRCLGDLGEMTTSLYAKGMSTRDIEIHISEIYGGEVSHTLVSNMTAKITALAQEWQKRPLESTYPVVFFDAVHLPVRDNGRVQKKAVYSCVGITPDGRKEILGLWIGENEGAKFWLGVCTELNNRGVQDILISCIDGLKGLPEAIKEIFPKTEVQLCVIHLIRNSLKSIPQKRKKEFMKDLKKVYHAPSENSAKSFLLTLQEKWGQRYPLAVDPWIRNWENIKTFYQFPEPIRRLIYTTNTVESLHSVLRKATKNKRSLPSDEALQKLLFLAARDISKKWTLPAKGWKDAISHFAILYPKRLRNNEEF